MPEETSSERQLSIEPQWSRAFIGHADVEAALAKSITKGRVPQALLFAGPPGIGKATLAYRFARALLNGSDSSSGGVFDNDVPADKLRLVDPQSNCFRLVANKAHPDLFIVEREVSSTTKRLRPEILVEQIRKAGSFLHLTPSLSERRVVIVDGADRLNRNAANALLKSLEEPSANTTVILIASVLGRVLQTLRSRCIIKTFKSLGAIETSQIISGLKDEGRLDLNFEIGEHSSLLSSAGQLVRLHESNSSATFALWQKTLAALPRVTWPEVHATASDVAKLGREQTWSLLTEAHLDWIGQSAKSLAADPSPPHYLLGTELDQWLWLWEKTRNLFNDAERLNIDKNQTWVTAWFQLESVLNNQG